MKTWAEEQGEHYRRIRTDPAYRLQEQMLQHEIDSEVSPNWDGDLVDRRLAKLEREQDKPILDFLSDKWYSEVQQLKSQILYVDKQIKEHVSDSIKRSKGKYESYE